MKKLGELILNHYQNQLELSLMVLDRWFSLKTLSQDF